MHTKLRVIVTSSCLLIALCSASLARKQKQTQAEDLDEYAVYSAVLQARYSTSSKKEIKRYVIAVETKNAFIGYRHGFVRSGETQPTVESETSQDFDSKNKDSFELTDKFTLPVPYSLVSELTLRKIFDRAKDGKPDEEGWHRFYKNYPGAPGIISFTRVGFDAKKTQALLYVAHQSDFLGGSGRFFVLSKQGDTWKIEKEVILWLS